MDDEIEVVVVRVFTDDGARTGTSWASSRSSPVTNGREQAIATGARIQ